MTSYTFDYSFTVYSRHKRHNREAAASTKYRYLYMPYFHTKVCTIILRTAYFSTRTYKEQERSECRVSKNVSRSSYIET